VRAGMRCAWRDFVRVESAETNDLRNNGGRFASIVSFFEYVATKIHTLRIFATSFLRHFR
jgi:hypothetical protein